MSTLRISDLPHAPDVPTDDNIRLAYEDRKRQNFYYTTVGDIVNAYREKAGVMESANRFTAPVYATGPDAIRVGDVLAVNAVDWAIHTEQTTRDHAYKIIHGDLYGQVIAVSDEGFTLAPQVFQDGDVRCALVIPFVCVKSVDILKAAV